MPAIVEQRRDLLCFRALVVLLPDPWRVVAVEHELQVRQLPRVQPQELQNPPDGEHIPRLEGGLVLLHVSLSFKDYQPKLRVIFAVFQHFPRDPGGLPGPKILVDPPEVLRTSLSVYILDSMGRRVIRWTFLQRSVVRADEWVSDVPR